MKAIDHHDNLHLVPHDEEGHDEEHHDEPTDEAATVKEALWQRTHGEVYLLPGTLAEETQRPTMVRFKAAQAKKAK